MKCCKIKIQKSYTRKLEEGGQKFQTLMNTQYDFLYIDVTNLRDMYNSLHPSKTRRNKYDNTSAPFSIRYNITNAIQAEQWENCCNIHTYRANSPHWATFLPILMTLQALHSFAWRCKSCPLSLPTWCSIPWRRCFTSRACMAYHLCKHSFQSYATISKIIDAMSDCKIYHVFSIGLEEGGQYNQLYFISNKMI